MSIGNNKNRDEFDEPHFMEAVTGVFDSLDQSMVKRSRKPFVIGFSAVVLIVFLSVLWYSYPREKDRQMELAVPIIRASQDAVKVTLDDRGGMEIPYKDSTVFSALSGSKNLKIENLLDDEETPLPRTEVFASDTDVSKLAAMEPAAGVEETINKEPITKVQISKIKAPEPIVIASNESAADNSTVTPVKTVIAPRPITKPKALQTNTEIAAVLNSYTPSSGNATRTISKPSESSYYVQLGSLTSREGASQAWENMKRRFPGQLLTLDLRIEEAYLKDRGTYYRIQGGPIDEATARNICKAISKKRPGGCLVIKK